MLRDPGDISLTLAYVAAAEQAGDFEGAIGALSKLLMVAPNLPEVHLRLAALYRAIGSYSMAETYYRSAQAQQLSDTQRRQAEGGLAAMAEAQSNSHFSALLAGGIAYQSNANAGPVGTARSFGVDLPGQAATTPKGDANLLSFVAVDHLYDLDDASRWHTTATIYATRQERLEHLNISYGRLTSGPRLALGERSSLEPYAIGELFALGSSLYFGSGGFGLTWTCAHDDGLSSRLDMSTLERAFDDSANYPTATEENTLLSTAAYTLSWQGRDGERIGFKAQLADNLARRGFNRFSEWQISPFAEKSLDSPWGGGKWTVSAEYSVSRRYYLGADPSVDPATKRRDTEWTASLSVLAPVGGGWAVLGKLGKDEEYSSLPNYRFGNLSVLGAMLYNF
ncbi:MAG TPA: tetratricopeptide repeat protein [Rhodospirillaceae bacterium]|nr:tetratricopeptide repeat protein [Rhodospirillaceae bacterium]